MKQVKITVELSWEGDPGKNKAQLMLWQDRNESIEPKTPGVFRKRKSPLCFVYKGDPLKEKRVFKWSLVFPDKTLKNLQGRVRFGSGKWRPLKKKPKKKSTGRWTTSGVVK